MTGKLTPARIAALHADLQTIKDLDRLITELNKVRAGKADSLGEAIRSNLGPMRMHDGPGDLDLGRAALDGIIASVALKRAEIEQRTAPYVDRGVA